MRAPPLALLAMADRDLVSLPFDLYQRYRLVTDLVEQYPAPDESLKVLDVGGQTAILRGFLPDAVVTPIDLEASDTSDQDLGELPFADGAFDVVTACDTLDQVPADRRDAFIREACRVSRGWVVLAGPYASERVVEAEELLRIFLREKLGTTRRFLDEHGERGLPDLLATRRSLESAGARIETIGHASLERWLPLMCLSTYLDEDRQLREVAQRYYRFYNETLYSSDHADPVYRHAVVGSVAGAPAPPREALLAPPIAPRGSLAAFDQLVGELVAFDREQEVYQVERQRLMAVNDGLVADLEDHRKRVEHLDRDLTGHQQRFAEYVERSERQAAVIETLKHDLEEHRETVGAQRAQQESLIEGHERVVAEQQALIVQCQATIDELEGELAASQEATGEQQAEVARVKRVARSLKVQLAEEQEENEELHAELGNRLHNLKRAFSLKKPTS